jgi:hypothetical protein
VRFFKSLTNFPQVGQSLQLEKLRKMLFQVFSTVDFKRQLVEKILVNVTLLPTLNEQTKQRDYGEASL